jgi:hypothetical protein
VGAHGKADYFMRVQAATHLGTSGAAPVRRPAGGSAFTLADSDTARAPAPSGAPRPVASLDLLVALQAYEDPGERRRRAVRHGRAALDALDALKLGLVAGVLDRGALARLGGLAESLAEPSGDPRLDMILGEIALRAAVELAKLSRS